MFRPRLGTKKSKTSEGLPALKAAKTYTSFPKPNQTSKETPDSEFIKELESKIDEQSKELQSRNSAVQSLVENVESIFKSYNEEKQKNCNLQAQVKDLQKKLKSNETAQTNKLEFRAKELQNQLAKSQANADNLQTLLTQTQNKLELVFSQLETLQHQEKSKQSLEKEHSRLKETTETQKRKIEFLNSELTKLKSSLLTTELKYSKLQEENSSLKQKHEEQLQLKANELRAQIHRMSNEIAILSKEKNDALDKLERAYKATQSSESNSKFSTQLETIKYQLETQIQAKEELKIQVKTQKTQIEDLNTQLKIALDAKQQFETKIQKLEELKGEVKTQKTQNEELNMQLNIALDAKQQLEEQTKQLNTVLTLKQQLEVKLHQLEEQTKTQTNQLSTALALKQQLKQDLEEHKHYLSKSTFKVQKLEQTIEELNQRLSFSQNKLEVQKLHSEVSVVSSQNQCQAQHEKELHNQIDKLKVMNSKLRENLRTLETKPKPKKNSQVQTENKHSDKKALIAQLQIEVAHLKQLKHNLKTELNSLKEASLHTKNQKKVLEVQLCEVSNILKRTDRLALQEKEEVLLAREKVLRTTANKLKHVVKSLETELSCMQCFNLIENAAIGLPCGHITCYKCTSNHKCVQCSQPILNYIPIPVLSDISSKVNYQLQVVSSVK